MTDHDLRRWLLDADSEPPTEHPPMEQIIALRQKKLAGAGRDALQDHVAACPICAELYRRTPEFLAVGARLDSSASTSPAPEPLAPAPAMSQPPIPHPAGPQPRAFARSFSLLAAGVLIGLGLALLIRLATPPGTVSPEPGAISALQLKTVALYTTTRSDFEIPEGSEPLIQLLFDPPESLPRDCVVSVRQSDTNRREVVRLPIEFNPTLGMYQVMVERDWLPPGDYMLLVVGPDDTVFGAPVSLRVPHREIGR